MVRATVDFLRFWSNSWKKAFLLIILDIRIYMVLGNIHIRHTFSSNHCIHKSSCGLCFWASDHLIDRFYCIFQSTGTFMNVVFWRKSISNTHMSSIRMKGKLSDTLNILYINIKIYNEKICCHAIHTCRIIIKKFYFWLKKQQQKLSIAWWNTNLKVFICIWRVLIFLDT